MFVIIFITICFRVNNGTAVATTLMSALNIESLDANEECFVLVECIPRETLKMIGESDSVKEYVSWLLFGIDFMDADFALNLIDDFLKNSIKTSSNLDALM